MSNTVKGFSDKALEYHSHVKADVEDLRVKFQSYIKVKDTLSYDLNKKSLEEISKSLDLLVQHASADLPPAPTPKEGSYT